MSTNIIRGVHPTRMELILLQRRRLLAEKGHNLLKEKRDALIMEFFSTLEDIRKLREDVNSALQIAFRELLEAKMVLGPARMAELSMDIPSSAGVDVDTKNIMGVRVPILRLTEETKKNMVPYNVLDTTAKMDEATKKFQQAVQMIVRLAETEIAVRKLAEEIDKTKRRVNALKYIIIPRIGNTIVYIQFHLEEVAREDFFRLKRIKATLERRELEQAR
ncbi:MAG: V-type ATP synthase subunit D [Promethearchaeati archaeon SRVP18_Atabeyarchaeia-1]